MTRMQAEREGVRSTKPEEYHRRTIARLAATAPKVADYIWLIELRHQSSNKILHSCEVWR
eukprot:SAG31_NODE_3750_length_3923_cov_7.559100_1_plen_60_part_00